MTKAFLMVLTLGVAGWISGASAETQFIINGSPVSAGGSAIQISSDQKLMFEAAKKVMERDFNGAEAVYNQVLSINDSNIDAYLQRSIVRREMGNEPGAQADARAVVMLANHGLQQNPNDANLYHRRGMGLRLLKDFGSARADIQRAIQMSGQLSWKTDLQAIELEEKAFK